MGVIDSISEGLAIVRRRPLLMAIPVLVDLFLWLAPTVSISPLTEQVADTIATMGAGAENAESVQAASDLLVSMGRDSNLLALLANSVVGIPSFLASGIPEGLWRPFAGVEVDSARAAVALALILALAGLAVGAGYLTAVAVAVQGQRPTLPEALRRAGRNTVRLLSAVLALVALLVLLGVPLSLFMSLLMLISPTLASLVTTLVGLLAVWAGLWALFYLFFVVDAMVLQEIGLQRSILNSVMVVRTNFWSVLGLIILLNVLAAGFTVVWHWVASMLPLGALVAVAGNTFVGSGLVAASLVFYRGRYEALLAKVSELGRS